MKHTANTSGGSTEGNNEADLQKSSSIDKHD